MFIDTLFFSEVTSDSSLSIRGKTRVRADGAEILISSAVLSILQQVAACFGWVAPEGWVKNRPKNKGFC